MDAVVRDRQEALGIRPPFKEMREVVLVNAAGGGVECLRDAEMCEMGEFCDEFFEQRGDHS